MLPHAAAYDSLLQRRAVHTVQLGPSRRKVFPFRCAPLNGESILYENHISEIQIYCNGWINLLVPARMPKSVFTDAYQTLLETLVAARMEAGLTQVELARRLGKPQPFVSYFERGERRIDVIEFCAVARALSYDPIALFKRMADKLPDVIEI